MANPSLPPIGLLLRKLDRLIDERFERTLGVRGITRRQWQLLHTLAGNRAPFVGGTATLAGNRAPLAEHGTPLAENSASLDALASAVAPFLDQRAEETVEQHLEPLAENGLIRADDDVYVLTEPGRAFYESLMIEVQTTRDLTVAGLADGEYERTVTSLQVMIGNLEAAA
ncbi:hypothetical protein ACWDV4_27495 [Micromonospora sp. NPDC003197]